MVISRLDLVKQNYACHSEGGFSYSLVEAANWPAIYRVFDVRVIGPLFRQQPDAWFSSRSDPGAPLVAQRLNPFGSVNKPVSPGVTVGSGCVNFAIGYTWRHLARAKSEG